MLHSGGEIARFLTLVLYGSMAIWCGSQLIRFWTRMDTWVRAYKVAMLSLVLGIVFLVVEVMVRNLRTVGYRYVVLDVIAVIVIVAWSFAGQPPLVIDKIDRPEQIRDRSKNHAAE